MHHRQKPSDLLTKTSHVSVVCYVSMPLVGQLEIKNFIKLHYAVDHRNLVSGNQILHKPQRCAQPRAFIEECYFVFLCHP